MVADPADFFGLPPVQVAVVLVDFQNDFCSPLIAGGGPVRNAGNAAPYTTGSAYAQFEETKKGQLKNGQYADFIILSVDLTKIPPAQYAQTKVLRTVVAGRTVYQSR